jgi:hypothetical protein
MANNNAKPESTNEGEGNKTAARHYNEATEKFARSGKVDEAARKAKEALDGPEGAELRKAEEDGKSRASDIEREADRAGMDVEHGNGTSDQTQGVER